MSLRNLTSPDAMIFDHAFRASHATRATAHRTLAETFGMGDCAAETMLADADRAGHANRDVAMWKITVVRSATVTQDGRPSPAYCLTAD